MNLFHVLNNKESQKELFYKKNEQLFVKMEKDGLGFDSMNINMNGK